MLSRSDKSENHLPAECNKMRGWRSRVGRFVSRSRKVVGTWKRRDRPFFIPNSNVAEFKGAAESHGDEAREYLISRLKATFEIVICISLRFLLVLSRSNVISSATTDFAFLGGLRRANEDRYRMRKFRTTIFSFLRKGEPGDDAKMKISPPERVRLTSDIRSPRSSLTLDATCQ